LPQEETGFVFFRSREDPWFALGKALLLGYAYEGYAYVSYLIRYILWWGGVV
jgi:hypothetical protein